MNNNMALSNEDHLRLQVLAAQNVLAIRINESKLLLYALTEHGEASIQLNPTCHVDTYLRHVRHFLSDKFLDLPNGYPLHIKRWTRMGDIRNRLDKMLLLGEPEAVLAVAYAPSITLELATYAWWAYQSPEVARQLLHHTCVIESDLGKELAQFILEFLPFEELPLNVVESVRLCLQGELVSTEVRTSLWQKAKRKQPYYVGFVFVQDGNIPFNEQDHKALTELTLDLNNPYAQQLHYFLTAAGRKWLQTLSLALKKPSDQDVVIILFQAIEQQIQLPLTQCHIEDALEYVPRLMQAKDHQNLQDLLATLPTELNEKVEAMLLLGHMGEYTLNPIFAGRDCSGSVMRKHLKPITEAMEQAIDTLLQ